jgi:hypothetical protein
MLRIQTSTLGVVNRQEHVDVAAGHRGEPLPDRQVRFLRRVRILRRMARTLIESATPGA